MDQAAKETLIAQFRAYLEEMADAPAPTPEDDTFSLFAELAALKNEIKREARQVKEALDEFKAAFDTLQASNQALNRELESRRAMEKELRQATLRPLLLQLLELRDRLEAGRELSAPIKHSLLMRSFRKQGQRLEALREGQEMTLRRLDRILGDYQVRPVEVMEKPLDPNTMRVIEVERRLDQRHGMVTGELRRGFFWDGELLRVAEVKVNKREHNS
ncbi:MAG: nucleotide exchange factor GrpE [Gammaproteobacteria bacterium]|jgi:molecular chaperone GrpE